MSVIPYFELHIRPMFRLLDRDHMTFKLDLWNYEQVRALAPKISNLLRTPVPGSMPTKETGGPWPEGWIETFELWVAKECPRLLLTAGEYAARRLGNGKVLVSVSIQLADGAADAWAERLQSAPTDAEYMIHLRPPSPDATEPPRLVQLKEVLPAETVHVFITDTSGRQEITVTS